MLEFFFGRLAARWRWLRTLLDVQSRFDEIKGGYLASAVSLPLFLSILPLLLVSIAVLGFITNNNVDYVQNVVEDLVPDPALNERLHTILEQAVASRRTASIVGFLLLLWSGLGLAAAIGYAIDAAWQLGGRGLIERLPGLLWGIGAAVLLTSSVALTSVVDYFSDGFLTNALTALGGVGINTLFFIWTFLILTSKRLPFRAHLPGAILGGIGMEVIKQIVRALTDLLFRPAAIWGSVGLVFAVIIILTIFGRLLVYAASYNVVKWERKYGTVTVEIEVPNLPGVNPTEANRGGAMSGDADKDAASDSDSETDESAEDQRSDKSEVSPNKP